MNIEINSPKKVKLKDLAVFSRQFATMVNSGLPILRALSILVGADVERRARAASSPRSASTSSRARRSPRRWRSTRRSSTSSTSRW